MKVRILSDNLGRLLIFDGLLWDSSMELSWDCCFVLALCVSLGTKKERKNSKTGTSVKVRPLLSDVDILTVVADFLAGFEALSIRGLWDCCFVFALCSCLGIRRWR